MKKLIILFILFLPFSANAVADSFILGVGTHIGGQDTNVNIREINRLGLNSLRDDFPWSAVEKIKHYYNVPHKLDEYLSKAVKANIVPLIILDYGNKYYDGGGKPVSFEGIAAFANYAGYVAKQMKFREVIFEVWNEWDHSHGEPFSVESYFNLVQATSMKVKENNNRAVVLAGSATPVAMRSGWVEELIRLGVMNYVDGISIHPYIHCERDKSPEAWINFLSQFSEKLRKANDNKAVPLYITEMGWPSHKGACGTRPEKVAQYLARTLILLRTIPDVKGFWWYDLKNDGDNIEEREHNFGLLNYDYTPKPAFKALQDIAPLIIKCEYSKMIKCPPGIVLVSIRDSEGHNTFALWSSSGIPTKVYVQIVPEEDSKPSLVTVGSGKCSEISRENKLSVVVDGTPLIFVGVRDLQVRK